MDPGDLTTLLLFFYLTKTILYRGKWISFVNQIVFLHLAIYFMLSTLVVKWNESSSELFYRIYTQTSHNESTFSACQITKVTLHFEVYCEP